MQFMVMDRIQGQGQIAREDTIETTGEIDYGLWIRPSFMVKGECP